MDLLLTLTAAQKRHVEELGLLLCLVGGVAVLLSAAFGLGSMSRLAERTTMVVAGGLLIIGFALQIVANHGTL